MICIGKKIGISQKSDRIINMKPYILLKAKFISIPLLQVRRNEGMLAQDAWDETVIYRSA